MREEEIRRLRSWLSYNDVTISALAEHIGVAPKYLSMMLKSGKIHPAAALQIESATGREISARCLCPQVFDIKLVRPVRPILKS